GLALLDDLPLVVTLSAAGDAELDLGSPVLGVHPEGHEGVTLLRDGADELADLVLVQEELSGAQRIVVGVLGVRPLGVVDVPQPDLATLDAGVSVPEVRVAGAERLDLGPA